MNKKIVVFEDLPKGWQECVMKISDSCGGKISNAGIRIAIAKKSKTGGFIEKSEEALGLFFFAIKDAKERGII